MDVLPAICSDHNVPCAFLLNNITKNVSFKRTIYIYNRLNSEKFCNLLSSIDWLNVTTGRTIDECTDLFTEIFTNIAKQCMPFKVVTVRSKDVPWLTSEIRKLIKKRDRLHRRAKRNKLTEDRDRFRQFRNFVTLKKREKKNEFLQELNIKASHPTRFGQKDWRKLVKPFMEKKGTGLDEIPPINCHGQIFYSNKEKAEISTTFSSKRQV